MSGAFDTKPEGGDWSPTFQRLRAECVFTSLLLLALTQLNMRLDRIPFLALEIRTPVSRGALVLFVWCFLAYSLVAWLARFRVETLNVRMADEAYRKYVASVTELTEVLSDLKPIDVTEGDHRISRLQNEIASLAKGVADVPEKFEQMKSELPGALTGYIGALKIEGVGGPRAHQGADARVVNITNAVVMSIDNVNSTITSIRSDIEALSRDSLNAYHMIRDSIEDASNLLADRLKHTRTTLAEVKSILSRAYRDIKLERQFLGFWVPFVTAIVLFGAATPQSYLDAKPSVVGFVDTFPNSLFRRERISTLGWDVPPELVAKP